MIIICGTSLPEDREILRYSDDTVRNEKYDDACCYDAGEDDRDGIAQAQIEECGDERACPGACSGEGNRDQEKESEHLVFHELLTAAGGFFFHFGGDTVELFKPVHPVEDAADEDNNERYRNHVSDDADDQRSQRGQPHTDANGKRSSELNDRNHGNEKCDQYFTGVCSG